MEDGETGDVLAPAVEAEEYGTPEEDAWRRDFTVNGLFYNIADFSVIDYVGGLADLRCRRHPLDRPAPAALRRGPGAHDAGRRVRGPPRRSGSTTDGRGAIASSCTARSGGPHRPASPTSSRESLKGGQRQPIFQGLEAVGLLRATSPRARTARCRPRRRPRCGRCWRPRTRPCAPATRPARGDALRAAAPAAVHSARWRRQRRTGWPAARLEREARATAGSRWPAAGLLALPRAPAAPRLLPAGADARRAALGQAVMRTMRHEAFPVARAGWRASWPPAASASGTGGGSAGRARPSAWHAGLPPVPTRRRRPPGRTGSRRRRAARPAAAPAAGERRSERRSSRQRDRASCAAEIRRHEHLYYVLRGPRSRDLDFDQLLAELRRLEAEHPELADTRLADPAGRRAAARRR